MSYTYLLDACEAVVLELKHRETPDLTSGAYQNETLCGVRSGVPPQTQRAEVLFTFMRRSDKREIRKEVRDWRETWMEIQEDVRQGWVLPSLCEISSLCRRALVDPRTCDGDGAVYRQEIATPRMRPSSGRGQDEQRHQQFGFDDEIGALSDAWTKWQTREGDQWTLRVNFICSPERGEESSAGCFSDIPVSVLSRLNLIPGPSCSSDSATESCPDSRSGTMSAPSTASPGGDLSMSCVEGSPVSHSLAPLEGDGQQSTYGPKCAVSPSRSPHASCSPRMCNEAPSSKPLEISRARDIWLDALEFPPPPWVPRINGEGSGYLPTLTSTANFGCRSMQKWPGHRRLLEATSGQIPGPTWWEWMMDWPEGWTALQPLAMDRFRQWLHSHGDCSPDSLDAGSGL